MKGIRTKVRVVNGHCVHVALIKKSQSREKGVQVQVTTANSPETIKGGQKKRVRVHGMYSSNIHSFYDLP